MQQIHAEVGDAFVRTAADGAWVIGNALIARTYAWRPGAGLAVTATTHAATGQRWDEVGGEEAWGIVWSGARLSGRDARSAHAEASEAAGGVRLTIALDLGGLEVRLCAACAPDAPVVQQWVELLAREPGTLAEVTPLAAHVALEGAALLSRVRGVQRQGGWTPEHGTYDSFRLQRVELGEARIASGPRSTWYEVPWFALAAGEVGEGVFVGLQYSGGWEAHARAGDGSAQIAVRPDGLAVELAPGRRWVSPRAFVGVFAGDLDDAAAAQHRFYRRVLSPPLPADFPWVQYNTWFSLFCDYDEATLRREAAIAAELGVELFYVDAGWWEGNGFPGQGSAFSSGLGTWRENRERFPNGLRALADEVRGLGMRFGLWVEPERVDLRTAGVGSWKPEWLAQRDGRYLTVPWPADTETAWLCFGHAETQAWAIDWIGRLVEELDLAWLKWDSNWWGVCAAPHHGHGAGDGEHQQVAGAHAVMAALRERFPHLIIENCAGGGTRMDFAMAEQTHVAWVSDASEPSQRVRAHLSGASYAYPPEVLNVWVAESQFENLRGRRLPRPILDALFRSRMLGALGLSCDLGSWLPETRAAAADAIREYKALRPLLRAGRLFHLLPQPTLIAPRLAPPSAWEAFQVWDAASGRGALLAFRNASPDDACTLRPRGLDPQRSYRLHAADGTDRAAPGATLMAEGVRCELPPLASLLWWLTPIG